MKTGVYAGSFDPFTNGHLYVAKQACELFDKVVTAICVNSNKTRRVDQEKMRQAVTETFKAEGLTNAQAVIYSGLVVDLAKEAGAQFLIRGLRNGTDYEYEENIADINHELTGIKTIYFRAGETSYISSAMVMEVLKYNGDIAKWVPESVLKAILNN